MQATILVAQQKDDLPQGRISQISKLTGRVDVMIIIISGDSKRLQSKNTFCHKHTIWVFFIVTKRLTFLKAK